MPLTQRNTLLGSTLSIVTYRRATVIINPEAGTHKVDRSASTIAKVLEDVGIEATMRITSEEDDTGRFATEAVADGTELLVVAGGDGTIMDAIGALTNSGIPLLPLPLGTWNGLVRMLGAPMSLEGALEKCIDGEPVKIDLGYIPELDHHFLLWAGAGIDAEVMAGAERNGMKKKFGYWAYFGALAGRLGGTKNRSLDLTIDGEHRRFEGHTVLAFNVNDLRFAGLQIGPVVDPHDAKMDLTVLTRPGVWGTLQQMMGVLTSGSRDAGLRRDGTWLTAGRVRIEAHPPLDVQADGEVVGKTPLTFEILPLALTVQAPRGYQGEMKED